MKFIRPYETEVFAVDRASVSVNSKIDFKRLTQEVIVGGGKEIIEDVLIWLEVVRKTFVQFLLVWAHSYWQASGVAG